MVKYELLAGLAAKFIFGYSALESFLLAFGVTTMATLVLMIANIIKKFKFTTGLNLKKRYGPDSYVCITGPAGGMGKRFAHEFASRDFNLLLVGWMDVEAVAEECRTQYGVKVVVIDVDFGMSFQDGFFDEIEAAFNKFDVSVMVNNIGHRTGWIPSHSQPVEDVVETIACGTVTQSRMTQIAMKKFLTRDKTYKCGMIFVTAQCMHRTLGWSVNMSNEFVIPHLSVYESANAYGYYHACGMCEEYSKPAYGDQFDLLNITPGAVITENTPELTLTGNKFSITVVDFVANIMTLIGNYQGVQNAAVAHDVSQVLLTIFSGPAKGPGLAKVGFDIANRYMTETYKPRK